MNDIAAELKQFLLACLLVFLAAVGVSSFLAGRYTSPTVAALEVEKRITDSVIVVRTETVTVVQRRVDTVKAQLDAIDTLVKVVDDSTVSLPDTVAVIPPLVVANLAALRLTVATQDTLIRALYQRDTTQQWRIETRDRLIRELSRKQLCDRRCTFVLGAATVAGFVYLVK